MSFGKEGAASLGWRSLFLGLPVRVCALPPVHHFRGRLPSPSFRSRDARLQSGVESFAIVPPRRGWLPDQSRCDVRYREYLGSMTSWKAARPSAYPGVEWRAFSILAIISCSTIPGGNRSSWSVSARLSLDNAAPRHSRCRPCD